MTDITAGTTPGITTQTGTERTVSERRDASTNPWSRDATVIVDVANLTHRIAEDMTKMLDHPVRSRRGPRGWSPQFVALRDAALDNLHRIVDVLDHHGVETRRLLLAVPALRFPPRETGWRSTSMESDESAEQERARFIQRASSVADGVARALRVAARGDIEVRALKGYFSPLGEHCVDEHGALAALAESWLEPGRPVHVVSSDADLSIAPWLAGDGPIILTRELADSDENSILSRLRRHRPTHIPRRELPPHVRLTKESLRLLMLGRAELPPQHAALQAQIRRRVDAELPSLMIETGADGDRLVDPRMRDRELTHVIGRPHSRRWYDLRTDALLDPAVSYGAVVVVDSFGLMTTANRAGVPARTPSVKSVERALAPLGIPGELAQLAVIPDIVDADHRIVGIAKSIDGHELTTVVREALTGPLKNSIRALDRRNQKAINTYLDDGKRWTIATTSVFGASKLSRFGAAPMALEEKESVVLIVADVLWALLRTDLPVVVLTDRADVMVALHVIEQLIGPERRMRERLVRAGMHTDTFSGEGIPVTQSHEDSPWTTVLLTTRMLVELLRLDAGREGEPVTLAATTDIVRFDAISGDYLLLDDEQRPIGAIPIGELARLPLQTIGKLTGVDRGDASTRRRAITTRLRLHLDLSRPLPRPTLLRPKDRKTAVPAVEAAGQVIGNRTGTVDVRVASEHGTGRHVVTSPLPGFVPAPDTEVQILIEPRKNGTCTLVLPDLSSLPPEIGRPRPATVIGSALVRLEASLDPDDVRGDTGRTVRYAPLLGPFPRPKQGDVILVTRIDDDHVQAVSTPVRWPTRAAG